MEMKLGGKLTGYLDCPDMVSQYFLIYSEAIKAKIKEISGKNSKTAISYPSLTHKGGRVVKLAGYLRLSTYAFQCLLIHSEAIIEMIKEI